MNRRVKLQLRMRQTVEWLSVAAISYYIVGLFGYLAKAVVDGFHLPVKAALLSGLFVPVATGFTWMVVRSIRKHHDPEEDPQNPDAPQDRISGQARQATKKPPRHGGAVSG